jgi:malate synthase
MTAPADVQIVGPMLPRYDEVLTPSALSFLVRLERALGARREELLERRRRRQARLDAGEMFGFLAETASIREADWAVPPPAPGLVDRRVEITGPTDRRMTINALNSGARVWMADFEDANTPTWDNLVGGQLNLIDALDRRIDFETPEGRRYALRPNDELATIVLRPRGWHLHEKHVLVDGRPMSGSLFDFGLYMAHCAQRQIERGHGPYFYLPKLESHLEARLWNDAFVLAEEALGLPPATIRATTLIETLPAAFEMDEILYELREHSAGLNAGRWDYLFSVIKSLHTRGADAILPDRARLTMTVPFMRAYTQLLVRTCHRRGAHAIGGMAAFIPSRRDPEVNAEALARVRQDKEREAGDGFDGSWVAHPDLVPLCREVYDATLGARPHQLERLREDVQVSAADLLAIDDVPGTVTEQGLRTNVSVALQYVRAWLSGTGAAAIDNLMEDVATAEISRSQIWQWLRYGAALDGGGVVTAELVRRVIDEELTRLDEGESYAEARTLLERLIFTETLEPFLTLSAYELLA